MSDMITNPENVTTSAESGDAITAGASQRPWRVEGPFSGQRETKRQHGFREYANVLDRNGIYIAQNLPPETAALVVDAVNNYGRELAALHIAETHIRTVQMERDRLRDIVRRLAGIADDYASLLLSTGERDAGIMDSVTGLVAEARAAVGRTSSHGPDNHRR
jgi:hypothetical protein